MSYKSNLNKNHWNDSMHIFFSPKLTLESKNLLPHIIDTGICYRQQNFLTVNKKPLVNVYERISIKKEKKPAVLVIGQAKQVQKRTQTTENKRKKISVVIDEQLVKNYRETITQMNQVREYRPKKDLSISRLFISRQKEQKYYFYIGPGNNAELVQQILGLRSNWLQTTSSLYHFRWQQTRPKYQNSGINKQLLNHLPNHEVISDKVGLVNSLKAYCQKNEEEMFNIIPNCFYLDFGNLESCEHEIKRFIQFYYDESERIHKFSQTQEEEQEHEKNIKPRSNSPKKMSKNQSTSNLANKSMNKNFRSTKRQSTPVPNIQLTKRRQQIKKLHLVLLGQLKTFYAFVDMSQPKKQNPYSTPLHNQVYGNTSLWLLKPADLNRGRGIHLFRTIEQLGGLLKNQLSKHEKGSFLVQKYIEKPMLIDNRKFDIRVYSLITQNKELYFFKEGYIRTSSTVFQVNSKNYFTHLTNNAIQKYSKTYGEFQQGNILPLNFLFRSCRMDKKTVYDQIKRKIKICTKAGFSKMFCIPEKLPNILTSSIGKAGNPMGNPMNKFKYFQIFGYDFMVDETGHIWLIQVNANPCIELSNQWLKHIIPRMLDDAFKLTLDKVFPKGRQHKQNPEQSSYYPVPDYPDNESLWQYIDIKAENENTFSSSIIN